MVGNINTWGIKYSGGVEFGINTAGLVGNEVFLLEDISILEKIL